uniref:Uncharacterized protein n=2 Tax=Oryza TaxID=4527 RepID=A0A0D3HVG9_9ORYZ
MTIRVKTFIRLQKYIFAGGPHKTSPKKKKKKSHFQKHTAKSSACKNPHPTIKKIKPIPLPHQPLKSYPLLFSPSPSPSLTLPSLSSEPARRRAGGPGEEVVVRRVAAVRRGGPATAGRGGGGPAAGARQGGEAARRRLGEARTAGGGCSATRDGADDEGRRQIHPPSPVWSSPPSLPLPLRSARRGTGGGHQPPFPLSSQIHPVGGGHWWRRLGPPLCNSRGRQGGGHGANHTSPVPFFVSSLTPSPLSVPRGLAASTAFLQLQGGRAERWHRRRRRWELSVARAIKSAADKRATSTNAEPYALLSAISCGPQALLSLISLIAASLAKTPKGSSAKHTTPPWPQRRGGQEREGGGDEAPPGMGTTTRATRFSATSSGEPAEVHSSSSSRKRADALVRPRAAFLAALTHRRLVSRRLGSSLMGTIFRRRRGHGHVALQMDTRSPPVLLVEMAAYSSGALVREMSSGLVRLVLE